MSIDSWKSPPCLLCEGARPWEFAVLQGSNKTSSKLRVQRKNRFTLFFASQGSSPETCLSRPPAVRFWWLLLFYPGFTDREVGLCPFLRNPLEQIVTSRLIIERPSRNPNPFFLPVCRGFIFSFFACNRSHSRGLSPSADVPDPFPWCFHL